MSETPKQWAPKPTPVAEDARPRVLFGERMIAFAADGPRSQLAPERCWPDGFHTPNEAFYIAGPMDLRPENHEKLKAKLVEKLAEAKQLPFSQIELANIKERFIRSVCSEVIRQFPEEMTEVFRPGRSGCAISLAVRIYARA
jgi:hypothetical protein